MPHHPAEPHRADARHRDQPVTTEDEPVRQVQVSESTLVALRKIQLKLADKDGKVPPLREVIARLVEETRK